MPSFTALIKDTLSSKGIEWNKSFEEVIRTTVEHFVENLPRNEDVILCTDCRQYLGYDDEGVEEYDGEECQYCNKAYCGDCAESSNHLCSNLW
jgi:uncharacterized CHY-type Zn-finger protein